MSYIEDLSQAREIFKSNNESVAGGDVKVYFWQPTVEDLETARDEIIPVDGEGNSIYHKFGLEGSDAIRDSSLLQQQIKNALSEYLELGVIDSWQEVGSDLAQQ